MTSDNLSAGKEGLQPIERVSVLDMTVNSIREFIQSDGVREGDKLPTEAEMTKRLGVGRSTIREAYRVLQTLGFVEMKAGRGAFVDSKNGRPTSSMASTWFAAHGVEVTEYIEVRKAIEPFSAELAAVRAREEQLKEIERIGSVFREAIETGDPIRMATLDEAFHRAIVEATGNTLLLKLIDELNEAMFEYRCQIFSVSELRANALAPHGELMATLKARDGDGARAAMTRHMEVTKDDVLEVMSRNERGE
jgi:GntR family transcriptional repressor for pyruvate dehydrogenase complex